jgi:hypothetical protein
VDRHAGHPQCRPEYDRVARAAVVHLTVPLTPVLPSSLTVTPGGLLDSTKVTDVVLIINYES